MLNRELVYALMWNLFNLILSSDEEIEPFIVNGENVDIEKHPFCAYISVSCMSDLDDEIAWWCGASILNQMILLTAAHCLKKSDCRRKEISADIVVGSTDRGAKHARYYAALSFKAHSDYDEFLHKHDIGLIRMSRPLKLSSSVKRVALADELITDEVAVVAGWGTVDPSQHQLLASRNLKEAKQKVLTRQKCMDEVDQYIPKGVFCGITGKFNKKQRDFGYPVDGDSGSALVVRDYLQIGITTFYSTGSRNSKMFTGYTDVTIYGPWIQKTARQLYCD